MNYVEFLDSVKSTLEKVCSDDEAAEIALMLKTLDPEGSITWVAPVSVGNRRVVGCTIRQVGFYWGKSYTYLDLELEMVFNFCANSIGSVDIAFGPWAGSKGAHHSYRYGMDETQTTTFVSALNECFEVLN